MNKLEFAWKLNGALIGCAIMLLFTLPLHSGFMILFFLLFLIPLFIYSIFVMYRKKAERRLRGIKLAIWVTAISVSLSVNYYRHTTTRAAANQFVTSIERYKSETGSYPDNLERIEISEQLLDDQLGISGYAFNEGKPFFYYAVTYIVFDKYVYDFELRKWQYRSS